MKDQNQFICPVCGGKIVFSGQIELKELQDISWDGTGCYQVGDKHEYDAVYSDIYFVNAIECMSCDFEVSPDIIDDAGAFTGESEGLRDFILMLINKQITK